MKSRIIKDKTRSGTESEYPEFSKRLNGLIQKLGIEKKDFAVAGAIAPQTLTGYLDGTSQPKQEVLAKWFLAFKVNLNWLVAGYGEMLLGEAPTATRPIPDEELSKDLTPEQRNMLTYKRLQTELGMDKQRIAEGIEAIVMGKRPGAKKSDKEPGFDVGVGFSEKDGDEAGVGEGR